MVITAEPIHNSSPNYEVPEPGPAIHSTACRGAHRIRIIGNGPAQAG
jgi:hypothetical protein